MDNTYVWQMYFITILSMNQGKWILVSSHLYLDLRFLAWNSIQKHIRTIEMVFLCELVTLFIKSLFNRWILERSKKKSEMIIVSNSIYRLHVPLNWKDFPADNLHLILMWTIWISTSPVTYFDLKKMSTENKQNIHTSSVIYYWITL